MICHLSLGGAVAAIDTMGGEMLSYRTANGVSCLWAGDPAVWAGHAPHLFPIIGTLPDGTHCVGQQTYPLTKHGFLRGTAFAVTAQTAHSITLLREETADSLAQYPFLFSFFVTHTLVDGGFQTQYTIVNRDTQSLPFCVGGHPSFACPVFADEAFSDYELVLHGFAGSEALRAQSDAPLSRDSSRVVLPIVNGVLPLSHTRMGDAVLIFENTDCHAVTLRSRKNAYAARLAFPDFPNFALWTFGSKRARYICVEPWHGLPCLDTDTPALADKPHALLLAAGAQKTLSYTAQFSHS